MPAQLLVVAHQRLEGARLSIENGSYARVLIRLPGFAQIRPPAIGYGSDRSGCKIFLQPRTPGASPMKYLPFSGVVMEFMHNLVPIVLFVCATVAFKALLDAVIRMRMMQLGQSETSLRAMLEADRSQRR